MAEAAITTRDSVLPGFVNFKREAADLVAVSVRAVGQSSPVRLVLTAAEFEDLRRALATV